MNPFSNAFFCALQKSSQPWDDFCKAQKKAFEKGFTWKSEVDVQQYYEHVPVGSLLEMLKNELGIKDEKLLNLLKTQLCTWAELFAQRSETRYYA